MENWKKIEGFKDFYEVSTYGRVRSIGHMTNNKNGVKNRFVKGKIKTQIPSKNGYMQVFLYKDKLPYPASVHRLVAEAFIPNPDNLPQVNHKDEDKTNNSVENLEWCDAKYNCNYGTRNERKSENKKKPVVAYNSDGELVYRFKSAKDAERLGFCNTHICHCCKGKRKKHNGLYWKYEEQVLI